MFAPSGAKKPPAKTTLGPFVSIHGDGTGGTLKGHRPSRWINETSAVYTGLPGPSTVSDLETAQGKLCTYLQCC